MADTPKNSNPFVFRPVKLDAAKHSKRRVIRNLPEVHNTETLQKFFGATVDHLFDPGRGRSVNGYIGQRPLWHDPDQDYYIEESTGERSFYQLETAMVSKNSTGEVSNLLFYPDLVNQIRFQGGLTDNHGRLFDQDIYTWCPPVDLDKIVNFRQYVWLAESEVQAHNKKHALSVFGPVVAHTSDGVDLVYYLPGYDENGSTGRKSSFYDLAVTKKAHITVQIDNVAYTDFEYNESTSSTPGDSFITLNEEPAPGAIVRIWVYSDFENNVLGHASVDPLALGSHTLSSGQRIRIINDKNTDYKPDDVYIVENVGTSIELILEKPSSLSEADELVPDYMVMARGCKNENPWSTANRWFHEDTLASTLDPDFVFARRAQRPILEYLTDLELFNYGLAHRADVDIFADAKVTGIDNLVALVTANPTSFDIDGVTIAVDGSDFVSIGGEGGHAGARLLVVNTNDPSFNNQIYAVTNQAGVLSLVLESSGFDPSGQPVHGEVVRIISGSSAGNEYHWNGSAWTLSQAKTSVNQPPLFALYDMTGVSLADSNTYPRSDFTGSKLFSYQEDPSETAVNDSVLGLPVLHDNKGDILFENYLGTERYSYVMGGTTSEIEGFYFHKIGNMNPEVEELSNDWFKSTRPAKQYVVDQYIADGSSRLFKASQVPAADVEGQPSNIEVWRGRVDSNNNFTRTLLEADVSYIRSDKNILITDVQKNDTIEIRTYNPEAPAGEITGHYDVPLNLKANPNNETVVSIGKGDFYSHFADIMLQQEGFTGAEYSNNNWRDTAKDQTKGSFIVQHGSPLLKTMLLASESVLDLTKAIRFVEDEYVRFKEKFHQKILDFSMNRRFTSSDAELDWIFAALSDINLGKTRDFPFYGSSMAIAAADGMPTFIPASPSFIGVYPLFVPELQSDVMSDSEGNDVEVWFVKGHDGSWTRARNEDCARVLYALEQRIWDSVPANVRLKERPAFDFVTEYGDGLRTADYSYDEFQTLLRPNFERWIAKFGFDYHENDTYEKGEEWSYNWSSIPAYDGSKLPGHWRGIYEKYFGTARPDLTPWEMLGFTARPSWWNNRYGPGPYTLDNTVLWDDIESGYIHEGPRAGTHSGWARPGFKEILPLSEFGELLNPYEAGIATSLPLAQDASANWVWGDNGPVEQEWRRSAAYPFAASMAAYLMKPAMFVELGWDTENLVKVFQGESREQWMNELTMSRPRHSDIKVHGELEGDSSLVKRVGIQQWVSDRLASRNADITTTFGDKVRGLDVQLAYKVGGFTDTSSLTVASDSFGRVPAEDIQLSLYRSPSVKEESYSGLAIEWTGSGFRVHGYDPINPYFEVVNGDTSGNSIKIGGTGRTDLAPSWKPGVYYAVNLTVRVGEKFYRCIKTHTSASSFEEGYWTEVARPQYADGTSLLWFQDYERPHAVSRITYGSILKTPQDVANMMNGYDRFLSERGWVFDNVDTEDDLTMNTWREALKSFIVWSQRDDLEVGDVLSLSPGSNSIKYISEHGTIQPIEQIVNGAYAVVDQLGRPIDAADTFVTRYDSEIKITSSDNAAGIYGLRLYVSEVEHVLVFNNRTIFNDVIYDPLLNIRQPRLRVQGFRTVAWQGRIDSPGFVVSNTTLTPNFEKAADDFRRFFDVEGMETKDLQERARANLGYEEREYLNNLLLGPTNQFEFYQGMIQQKGSPTSMRRLLRSNFIRHNKGLQLLEEWAFRVGDYGGSEMTPSMEFSVEQNDFKHNPQMFEFNRVEVDNPVVATRPGVTTINDFVGSDGSISGLDPRWAWRPEEVNITWPMRDIYVNAARDLPTAGFVKLDEVRWTCPRSSDWNDLVLNQMDAGVPVEDGDRVWYYGVDDVDAQWKTAKYYDTGLEGDRTELLRHNNSSVFILANDATVKEVDKGEVTTVDCNTNPDDFYLVLEPKYRTEDEVVAPEILVLEDAAGDGLPIGKNMIPVFKGSVSKTVSGTVNSASILNMVPDAGMVISKITIEVTEEFSEGSTFSVGTDVSAEEFVRAQYNDVVYPDFDSDVPVQVVGAERILYIVDADDTTVDVELVRVGRADPCDPTEVTWHYQRPSDSGFVLGGDLTYSGTGTEDDETSHYLQIVQVPIDPVAEQDILVRVVTDGDTANAHEMTIRVVRPASGLIDFVDITQVGVTEMSCDAGFTAFPYVTTTDIGDTVEAAVYSTSPAGKATITVEYYYTRGFEAHAFYEDGGIYPVPSNGTSEGGKLYTWIPTLYSDVNSGTVPDGLWNEGDIIEVLTLSTLQGGNEGWAVQKYNGTDWETIRIQNWKIDSDILTSAAIYDSNQNELKMVLQLYDPGKGYIPGVADRELHYKMWNDPAVYGSSEDSITSTLWGQEQVGRLWWDLNTVRYLDYEIYDDLDGGVDYRWKNWGRIAPGTNVDILEWTRSPVPPVGWADYVKKQNPDGNNRNGKPTGKVTAPETKQYVQRLEWNKVLQREETVYYFWVESVTSVPTRKSRKLSAVQVASIIKNPSAADIPFFAVIDHSRVILGGVKQFVADQDTVLKIKWKQSADNDTPHHKQWILIREQDERNTIEDSLWNKMRDSLVGWDDYVNESGVSEPKSVPDSSLPAPQRIGNLVRPRQSWFKAEPYGDKTPRPSRAARATFVECLNGIFADEAYRNIWYNWRDVFEAGEELPNSTGYQAVALDLADMQLMVSPTVNSITAGERVLIENTVEAGGMWTLWECFEENGILDFVLVDFQKWKLQEGDLWSAVDWYADGWSATDFPVHRFPDQASRDAYRPQDYTLLRGTLVQVNHTNPGDNMWSWYAYNDKGYTEVGRRAGTFKLNSAFYDETKTRLGPEEVEDFLNQGITPANVLTTLGTAINNRDGSRELQFLIDSLGVTLLTTLQKNKVFFEMVKSAFRANRTVDWAFKTSFLYLGGYSEDLRQSPVAFKDQVDNVVAYLEEVKPYHVKIREYVRRLSYGPDVANMTVTDFDKPVYLDQTTNPVTNRRLELNNSGDLAIMSTTRPWKDWYENYGKTNYDIVKWDKTWNPIRRFKTQIKFDRVSCAAIRGWDTSPWDSPASLYAQDGSQVQTLSDLAYKYRNEYLWDEDTQSHDLTKPHSDYYFAGANRFGDQAVNTVDDLNELRRTGKVTKNNQGTIVTVRIDQTRHMWTGRTWIQFEAPGWDQDTISGAIGRVEEYYSPISGMAARGHPGLISGCDFEGTNIVGTFNNGTWDMFEWGSTGWSSELDDRVGQDTIALDGNSTTEEDYDISVHGNDFISPGIDGRHPEEQVYVPGRDSLIFTVFRKDEEDVEGPLLRWTKDLTDSWTYRDLCPSDATLVEWDQVNKTVTIDTTDGEFPFHDPANPSEAFIENIKLSFGYYSESSNDMSLGLKTFDIRDLDGGAVNDIPLGIVGTGVRVVIENAVTPALRMIGTVQWDSSPEGDEQTAWTGSIDVDITGYVGDDPADLATAYDEWNIIPLEQFDQPGLIWIGTARFTYKSVAPGTGNQFVLSDAYANPWTLAGIDVASDMASISVDPSKPIYNGLCLKSKVFAAPPPPPTSNLSGNIQIMGGLNDDTNTTDWTGAYPKADAKIKSIAIDSANNSYKVTSMNLAYDQVNTINLADRFLITKHDSAGVLSWEKEIQLDVSAYPASGGTASDPGPIPPSSIRAGTSIRGGAVEVDDNGDVITATTFLYNNLNLGDTSWQTPYRAYTTLHKFSGSDGSVIWSTSWDNELYTGSFGQEAIKVVVDGSSIIVTSYAWVRKFASDGSLTWSKKYVDQTGSDSIGIVDLIKTQDGNYAMIQGVGFTGADLLTKIDSNGAIVWSKGVSDNSFGGVLADSYYLTGSLQEDSTGNLFVGYTDFWWYNRVKVFKYNASGDVAWCKVLTHDAQKIGAPDTDWQYFELYNGSLVVGDDRIFVVTLPTLWNGNYVEITELSQTGDIVFDRQFNHLPINDQYEEMPQPIYKDGHIVIGLSLYASLLEHRDMATALLTLPVDSEDVEFGRAGHLYDATNPLGLMSLAIEDYTDYVTITGSTHNLVVQDYVPTQTSSMAVTVSDTVGFLEASVYEPVTQEVLDTNGSYWLMDYYPNFAGGNYGGDAFVAASCTDNSGNVYAVTDYNQSPTGNEVVKMDSDGNVIWKRHFYGGWGGSIAREDSRIVTDGTSLYVMLHHRQAIFAKLNASDGAVVWCRTDSFAGMRYLHAMRLGTSGLYIAGRDSSQNANIACLSLTDGTNIFSKRLTHLGAAAAVRQSYIQDMVIDTSDNIYIAQIALAPEGYVQDAVEILKLDSTASTVTWSHAWSRESGVTSGAGAYRRFGSMTIDDSNNVYVTGDVLNVNNKLSITKISEGGAVLWENDYTFNEADMSRQVSLQFHGGETSFANGKIVTRYTWYPAYSTGLLVVNTDGTLAWSKDIAWDGDSGGTGSFANDSLNAYGDAIYMSGYKYWHQGSGYVWKLPLSGEMPSQHDMSIIPVDVTVTSSTFVEASAPTHTLTSQTTTNAAATPTIVDNDPKHTIVIQALK